MLIINLSIEWGWQCRFACFVHSMFLHLPSSCQGLLLSSYLPTLLSLYILLFAVTFVSSLFRSFGFQVDQLLPQVLGLVSQGVTISPPLYFGVSTPARLPIKVQNGYHQQQVIKFISSLKISAKSFYLVGLPTTFCQ